MSGFFEELKRRKVYRVAIAYIVCRLLLEKKLAQVLPVFEIPNSVIRVVIALLLIGFPVAFVSYRGHAPYVRDIGKALGVSTILEGSVRRAGNRVRVNVQLIDAVTDEHLWANDYERDLTDVYAIQSDLAQKIADELKAKLS